MLDLLPLVPLLVQVYLTAGPVCTFVLPSATSPSITDVPPNGNSASKAKHRDPGHYICVPPGGTAPRGMMVFVPGLAAADYTSFAEAAAETGLAAAVISIQACSSGTCCAGPKALNCTSKEPGTVKAVTECNMNNRMMRLLGNGTRGVPNDPAHYESVSASNSIVGRFKALASHLGDGGNATLNSFGRFIDGRGEPKWGSITASGHSCASYYPLLMGTLFPVERVVMTGGVGGSLTGFKPLQVPADNVYGFVRSADCSTATAGSECQRLCTSCGGGNATCPATFAADEPDYTLLGLPGQAGVHSKDAMSGSAAVVATAMGGARQLFDRDVCVFPGRPIMTHLCEICDLQTHRYRNGTAVMAPIWRYLVSNTNPVTPAAAADTITCNNTAPALAET